MQRWSGRLLGAGARRCAAPTASGAEAGGGPAAPRRGGRGAAQEWSPQQIAGRLVEDFSGDEAMCVSHETIYQALFLPAKGELKTERKLALGHGCIERRPRRSRRPQQARIAGW